jgi:hypothetical protein
MRDPAIQHPGFEGTQGWVRLNRYHAGRELRVRGSELADLMRRPAVMAGTGNRDELTPEKEAELYLRRRRGTK